MLASRLLWFFGPMRRGRDARLLRPPHQLGDGNHAHLLHYAGTRGLNRAKLDAEFCGDLLVEDLDQ
jgi:hypothetical protein